ncbi:intracellular chloride channel [Aureococcus anophagefferens]|nr:intracellular chloride channel [Aureococcus anophagefferens]
MGSSSSKEFTEPLIGYKFPTDRVKMRQVRNYPTDADAAVFDPTADNRSRNGKKKKKKKKDDEDDESEEEDEPEEDVRMSWVDIEQLWFQAISGDEDRKKRGIEWLEQEWISRFRTDTADELNYKLKFRGEVDPGPEFWQKWADHDADGNPIYVELVEEGVLYEKNKANEILEDLYHAGKIGPNDMAVFENEEPSKKHWSRRVHTLERIADKVPVSNRYPAYADFDTNPKERHLYEEYPSVRGRTIFLPKDRLYLTKRIIDEQFDFGVLVENDVVKACMALHDANFGETPTLEWFHQNWVYFWSAPYDLAGAPQVSMVAIDKGEGPPLPGHRVLRDRRHEVLADVSDETEGLHPQQIFLAFFLVVWSAYYKEGWDVEQQYCAVKWGTTDFEEEEADRPQFVGDPQQPRRLSPITNQNETYYPQEKRARTQAWGYLVVLCFTSGLLVIVIASFWVQYQLVEMGMDTEAELMSLFQAGLIQVLSRGYSNVAYYLNAKENYKTQTDYDNNLVLKKFGFEIFNNYSAAITAYFKGTYFQCIEGNENCLADLKYLLISIFFRGVARGAREPAFALEGKLEAYEGTFDDYAEIVLQMGLVCMFSLGWYFVPSLAIVEILLQMRADAYNLTCTSQRPTPTPAETVGSWGLLMDAMSLLAVFTNAGIVCYTTKSLKTYSSNEKLLFFFVFEQLLLLAKMITHVLIPDCPPELYAIKKRQEHVVDRHKNVVFDDDDDDDDDEGDGLRKGNVDRSSVRSGHGHDDEGAAGLSALVLNRIQYLEAKLKACDSDITIAEPAENIGSRHDPVDPKSCRIIVHVRDTTPKHDRKYEGNPGPAPQVSKPAKKPPKSNEMTEEQRTSGVRMVFNQSFSLAPIKTMKAEIYIEIMDNPSASRRARA